MMTATSKVWDPIATGEIPLSSRLAVAPMARDRSTPGDAPTGTDRAA
jgi:2,4-dienoyl-CoA reductase-like NADH-dependent reductase (Old Yellow Enzyme family)